MIYFIFPDFIPGVCDDISLLIVERTLNNTWNQIKSKQRKSDEVKKETSS